MLPEELIETKEVGFDDETNGSAGAKILGGFEERSCVGYELVYVTINGASEEWVEAVEAAEEIVVDFIVRWVFVASAVSAFREIECLFGGKVLLNISITWKQRPSRRLIGRKQQMCNHLQPS